MNKNLFRKILSIVLTTVMIICSISLSASAAEKEKIKPDCPIVDVVGFLAEHIYTDKNDENSEPISPMDYEKIIDAVKKCVPGLIAFSATQDWDVLADNIIPVFQELFEDWFNNPDGTTKGNSGAYLKYPTADEIEATGVAEFAYDWRGDPIDIAAELNDFINHVCEVSGSEQVSISCHSLGGIITLSYLTVYGNEKVKGVMFNSTAIYGEAYTGEMMTGNLKINADSLVGYLKFAFEGNEYEQLMNDIAEVFKEAGILDFVCEFADVIVENLMDRAYPEVVAPLFAGWPTIWAMVPDEYIDEAMNYVFGTIYKDSDVDRSGLIEKINKYNTLVRENKTQTLLEIDETSRVAVISRYGYSSIPATSSWQNLSDGVVDTKYSSFGATTALYGETLNNEYLEGKDMAYISPDRTVDASTCLFPEKTWFIKSLKHADETDNFEEMITTLLYGPEEATVDAYEEYPRFMTHDYDADLISADKTEAETNKDVLYWLRTFFFTLIKFIKSVAS